MPRVQPLLVLVLVAVGLFAGAATASADPFADMSVSEPQVSPLSGEHVGENLTWSIYVTNGGDDSAATLTDELGDGESFVSAVTPQGSCSQTAPVTCDLGTIASGAQIVVRITVKLTKAGTDTNRDSL